MGVLYKLRLTVSVMPVTPGEYILELRGQSRLKQAQKGTFSSSVWISLYIVQGHRIQAKELVLSTVTRRKIDRKRQSAIIRSRLPRIFDLNLKGSKFPCHSRNRTLLNGSKQPTSRVQCTRDHLPTSLVDVSYISLKLRDNNRYNTLYSVVLVPWDAVQLLGAKSSLSILFLFCHRWITWL